MSVSLPPGVIDFIKQPLASQLAMTNPNGSPHQTIMWYRYEAGDFLFTTCTNRIKYRNFQHSARGSLTIMAPENMWRWVILTGAFSEDHRDPVEFYRDLATHYLKPDAFEAWEKNAILANRTVLRLTPKRVRTLGFDTD